MKIVLASRNNHKIAELQVLLGQYTKGIELISLNDAGIYGDVEENGATFMENAMIKARAAAASGYIGLGDDSGLSVNALGGAPGIFSARYAGGHGNDSANNALLLENLRGVGDRSAQFVCALACVFPDGRKPVCVSGYADGVILDAPRGNDGFGYDPLFFIPALGKTFAELTPDEKNAVSHRGAAIKLLAEELKKENLI